MAKKKSKETKPDVTGSVNGKSVVINDETLSDILLIMDKEELSVKAVSSMGDDGEIKSVDADEKNQNSFLHFDKRSSIVESFIKNFWSQFKDPTRFKLIKLNFDDFKKDLSAIKDFMNGKETDAVKSFMEKYEVKPKEAVSESTNIKKGESMEQTNQPQPTAADNKQSADEKKYRFNESLIDWEQLKNFGISKEYLTEKGLLEGMLKGYKTNITVPISMNFGSAVLKTDARLSFQQSKTGSVVLAIHGIRKEPELNLPYFGHIFSDEDKKNLKETGNMGRVAQLKDRNGEIHPAFISIDKITNEILAARADKVFIPKELNGVKLDENEINSLKEGKAIYLEGLISKNNKEFNCNIQVSAEKRGIEYIFRNDRLFNNQTMGGVQLSPKQIEALNDGKAILVEGMKSKAGDEFDRFIKLDEATGRPQMYSYNPDSHEGAREIIVPKELCKIPLDQNDRHELGQGKTVFIQGMINKSGQEFDSFVKLDMESGRPMYSKTPDGFSERPEVKIPPEIMGVLLTPKQRGALQEGKSTLVKGILGYDGNKIDQYAKVNPTTGTINLYNDNPDLFKNASRRNIVEEKKQENENKTNQSNKQGQTATKPRAGQRI